MFTKFLLTPGRWMCLFIFMAGFIPVLLAGAARAGNGCSPKMNGLAISVLSKDSHDWQSLREHHRRFFVCDDGELGEGYSDAVVKLLSRKWSQFGTFAAIAKKDASFREWAVKHIDASASDNELRAIVDNASTCKQRDLRDLCDVVKDSAQSALFESLDNRYRVR